MERSDSLTLGTSNFSSLLALSRFIRIKISYSHLTASPTHNRVFNTNGGMMAEKKFEKAMQRLEEIVQGLEEGDLSLEDSLKAFEEGMKLLKFCSNKLEEAEQKVTLLVKESDGKQAQVPFEPEEENNAE
jgi:exodeoxyribonuclease VII small subunit